MSSIKNFMSCWTTYDLFLGNLKLFGNLRTEFGQSALSLLQICTKFDNIAQNVHKMSFKSSGLVQCYPIYHFLECFVQRSLNKQICACNFSHPDWSSLLAAFNFGWWWCFDKVSILNQKKAFPRNLILFFLLTFRHLSI